MTLLRERRGLSTALGLLAILLWSATFAVSRSLAEKIGFVTAGAAMLIAGGVLGCLYVVVVEGRRAAAVFRLPRAYLLGCGALLVTYMVCLFLSIGLAASRQQTIEVGIINYLWPGLTLVFAIPILGANVRWSFFVGLAMAAAGAALAPLRLGEYSAEALLENLRTNPLPYGLALVGAIVWALYSVLSRRWAGGAEGGGVPLFTLAAGLVLLALRPAFHETSCWSLQAAGELAFMAVFPVMIAYAFWDRAMRLGNVTFVAAASYLTPLLSTVLSVLYLRVDLGWNLWLACGLIVAGAVLAQGSVVKPARPQA